MATAEQVTAQLHRNRSPWSRQRQQNLQTQQVLVALPTQITTSTDPAYAPLGTEVAAYSSEFLTSTVPPSWIWRNQRSGTATISLGRLLLTATAAGAGTNQPNIFGPSIGSDVAGAWAIRSRCAEYNTTVNFGGGLACYCSGTGKALIMGNLVRTAGAPTSCRLITYYIAALNNGATTTVRDDNPPLMESRLWIMQMRYDGTTLYADYSPDNVYFYNIASVAAATALGGVPTQFGFSANAPAATGTSTISGESFRVYQNALLNQAA